MRVEVISKDDNLSRFANKIGAIGDKKGRQAFSRAVNRVTAAVEGHVIRAIGKQSSIPAKIVRVHVKKKLASPKGAGEIEGVVYATGKPIPLKEFNARQFSFGVRAKVWGKTQRFPGAFIYAGTYNSGNPVGNGHVFHRLTKESNPIEMMFGPSVPEEMVRDEAARVFHQTVQTMLPMRVERELSRLLP